MITLLLKESFSKITIKELATTALINRNTFYLHYKDKYDLVSQMIQMMISQTAMSVETFIEQPFRFFSAILADTSATTQLIVKNQKDDRDFQEIVFRTILELVTHSKGSNSQVWFAFGKVSTIFTWYHTNGLQFDLVQDDATLQRIYETETFQTIKP